MSKNLYLPKEIQKLLGRAADLKTPLGIGGGAVLKTPQHALDGPEHTEATATDQKLATTGHSGLLRPLSGDVGDRLAGDGSWQPEDVGSGVTLAQILTAHRFPVSAHRGDIGSPDSFPEDSLEAVRQAALKGAHIVEWDAAQSADGTFWGSHDTTVDRVTSASGAISGKTDATLAGYHYDAGFGYDAGRHGSSIGLCTLADVLEAIEQYGCALTIELKGGSPADLAQAVLDAGWGARTIIEVSTLADAATVKGVEASLTVLVNQSVAGSGTDANVDWLSWDSASLASLSSAQAKAPKVIKAYQSITDYGVSEVTPFANAWAFGARSYQANNLDAVLDLYASLYAPAETDPVASAHIADASDAHDASAISIADAGAYYGGTDVEAALQEAAADIETLQLADSGAGATDHAHIDNVTFSGDGATTAFELPAAPFDAYSVAAYVAGTRTAVTLSGTLLTTMTFGAAPASATDNITVDIVAAAA